MRRPGFLDLGTGNRKLVSWFEGVEETASGFCMSGNGNPRKGFDYDGFHGMSVSQATLSPDSETGEKGENVLNRGCCTETNIVRKRGIPPFLADFGPLMREEIIHFQLELGPLKLKEAACD